MTHLRYAEQERMREYAEGRECLMRFLARELDDPAPALCGRCAVCRGEPLLPETYSPAPVQRAVQFLKRSDGVIQPRVKWPHNALSGYGWAGDIPVSLRAQPGRALCIWGDVG